ncbi:acid protease [Lindgomyces ingoldianus]|uniref:Acid protease n=1 Tax=Lindgomyces ingoldianus TaxID=673940 RepID=A0ACB6RGP5_9PLEO|nr:acid protease [Lindgomyces ingoldianus]KAF2477636.1 acid protease [Lindgomyces ingoldianus]
MIVHREQDLKGVGLGLPLYNDLAHQRYTVNVTVGTPPQPYSLTIDTGSSDFWLPLWNSSGCAPDCPTGTFDPRDSSTVKDTGLPYNATFGLTPDLRVVGRYYNETVTIGGIVIPDMTLGVGDVPPTLFNAGLFGIIGLSSPLGEAIYSNPSSPKFHQAHATFPTLWQQLYLHGYISKRLFSIWLNKQSATTGSILFGGIDSTKYSGEIKTVPVVKSASGPIKLFTGWAVNLTSVTRRTRDAGGVEDLMGGNLTVTTVLDSGSPNMYLPTSLYASITTPLHPEMYNNTPYVLCSLRISLATTFLTFGFGSPGYAGPEIAVPYEEIIYPFGFPANAGEVRDGDGKELCYLGVIATEGPVFLLGDTLIRSAYVVYDVDGLKIGMAQARYGDES